MEPAPPKVFVSYSHDSPGHEARVLELCDRLRADGIDAILDQYEPFPRQGWIRWMDEQLETARFVLVVCTETYSRRAGLGATYEAGIIQQLLYNTGGMNDKFLPVIFTAEDRAHVPLALQRYRNFLLPAGYDDLYRVLNPDSGRLRALPRKQPKADFRNALWNVPAANPFFTARENYLEEIHRTLTQDKAAAIAGIGGIGKTQIAIEYAHRHRGEYEAVLWTGADADSPLHSGFATLAAVLDLPERNEKELSAVAAAVTRWFESHSGWLLVLDNLDTLDDLNAVRRLIPPGATGHLLITTRLKVGGRIAKQVDIEEMNAHDGALFLLRRAGVIARGAALEAATAADRQAAETISKEVDGLPLALDQAGAFIEETPSTLAEYLDLYRTEGARLRALRGDMALEHASVTVTFSLAFSRLTAKNPAAADLVRACAFLAPGRDTRKDLHRRRIECGSEPARLRRSAARRGTIRAAPQGCCRQDTRHAPPGAGSAEGRDEAGDPAFLGRTGGRGVG